MRQFAYQLIFLIGTLSVNASSAQDTTKVVTAWLKQQAIHIKTIEPGTGFSDLMPLEETWKDLQAIGLGEATHGTHEFFRMKHRLIEFLVTRLGFTDFVLESSYSACQPINDYILTGKGDRTTVLTGQGYTAWDMEEFAAIIDWMRNYNQKAPNEKKVRFHGMDLCFNDVGRRVVGDYLKQYAPDKVAATNSLFSTLTIEEEKWPTRLNKSALQNAYTPLQELVTFFTSNKERLINASSHETWEKASHHTEVMRNWVVANIEDSSLPFLPKPKPGRDEGMIENIKYLLDHAQPNAKFMVWAHHSHIAANNQEGINIGTYLKERLGNRYYALDLDCNKGTFQSRVLLPDGRWGELKADTIPAGPMQSFSWYLSNIGKSPVFVDLRPEQVNHIVSKWLETPKEITWGGWGYGTDRNNKPTSTHKVVRVKGYFDGVLFIEHSTPTHPTKNALSSIKNNIGF